MVKLSLLWPQVLSHLNFQKIKIEIKKLIRNHRRNLKIWETEPLGRIRRILTEKFFNPSVSSHFASDAAKYEPGF